MMDADENGAAAKPKPVAWPPAIADPLAPVSVHFAPPNEAARRRYEGALRRRPLEEGLAGGGGEGKEEVGERENRRRRLYVDGYAWLLCVVIGRLRWRRGGTAQADMLTTLTHTPLQPEFLFVQLPKRLPGLVTPEGNDAADTTTTSLDDDIDGPLYLPPSAHVKTEAGAAAAHPGEPSSLPPLPQQQQQQANGGTGTGTGAAATTAAPLPPLRPPRANPLARAGSGYLGRIRVHASGRMTFVAGV